MTRIRTILDLLTTVVILATCAVLAWAGWASVPRARRSPPVPKAPVELNGAAVIGDPAAPVVVIEFSDFQCPFCGAFERDTFPVLMSRYIRTGQVRFAYRHDPIERLHPAAAEAAQAAACAERQRRFWEMKTELFRDPKQLERSDLEAKAEAAGLDKTAFDACMADPASAAAVRRDAGMARDLGITGTPAFLIGRAREDGRVAVTAVIAGARPVGDFTAAINDAARAGNRRWWMWSGLTAMVGGGVAFLFVRSRRSVTGHVLDS